MTSALQRKLCVLWAVDGSSASANAIPLLRDVVLPVADRLIVLTVAPHSILSGSRPDPGFLAGLSPGARRNALLEAQSTAEAEATRLDPAGVPVEALSRWGNPIEEILRMSRSANIDMVVMGAKGHSNLGLLLLGSVAQGVVQHATVPVLIARPGVVGVERVLIGYDGSPPARRAVETLERLALTPTVSYTVTSVVEPFTMPPGTSMTNRRMAAAETQRINERHHRSAERSLALLAAKLGANGRSVQTSVLAGAAGPKLEDLARDTKADLVVVGSRKPSPARHYLLGTTAEKLVRHSQTSVLVVR